VSKTISLKDLEDARDLMKKNSQRDLVVNHHMMKAEHHVVVCFRHKRDFHEYLKRVRKEEIPDWISEFCWKRAQPYKDIFNA